MLFLPLLTACSDSPLGFTEVPTRDTDARPAQGGDDAETLAEDDAAEPTVTEEAVQAFPEESLSDWLFTQDTIHTVDFTISAESEAALGAAPYEWAAADVTIDGEPMVNVGVRLRGKIGSYRTLAGKPKFKISFGEFQDGQAFYGLEELSLNNSVVDCSYMKEVVGFRLYELARVPWLRTTYTQVTVNGAAYGLYVMLETPSDEWLDRHWDDGSGNLYDGKYVWYGGYSYTLLDFAAGVDGLYQLEEGDDVANADIAAVSAALTTYAGTADFYTGMGEVLDWDAFHRMTVVDQFLGHNDGYSMNTNNYRVYFDPADGKAEIIPWDLDYSFLYDYSWGLSWANANGNITNACFADPTCASAHRVYMADFLALWEAEDWDPWLDEIEALTYTATQTDPRRECAAGDVQVTRDYVRAWLDGQAAAMRAWWAL